MEDRTLLSSFVVSNTGDSGPGSLRQAILDANAQQSASDITFDPTAFATPQTITLSSGQLDLSDPTGTETITGPGANLLTISGNDASRVFQIGGGVTASVWARAITGGHPAGDFGYGGGRPSNLGTTTLTNCTVGGNSAARGGGVSAGSFGNLATTTLINCTVSGNSIDFKYGQGGGPADQLRHDHADQLHRQRKLRQQRRRRPVQQLRHGHADQLHRQRKLRPLCRWTRQHQLRRCDHRQHDRRRQRVV